MSSIAFPLLTIIVAGLLAWVLLRLSPKYPKIWWLLVVAGIAYAYFFYFKQSDERAACRALGGQYNVTGECYKIKVEMIPLK